MSPTGTDNTKPYVSTDELAGPAYAYPSPGHPLGGRPLARLLAGPLWLLAGAVIALAAVGIPGCTATGGPTVSAKGEVSVKEVAHHVALANADRGTGELNASLVLELKWPTK